MGKIILGLVAGLLVLAGGYLYFSRQSFTFLSPLGQPKNVRIKDTSLTKYGFGVLQQQIFVGSEITKIKILKDQPEFTSWYFSYEAASLGKKITGMYNLPSGRPGKLPVIVMIRGYVDDNIYYTGIGTEHAADFFAKNGSITLAPDFLNFGGSDQDAENILEARFTKPVEVLELLASIKNIPEADPEKVFLWGHSNGGQIALSVLEISKKNYPTVLWAPVSKGFPESVLTYLGELDDQGKMVVEAIDNFKLDYDPKNYSIDDYWADIQAPIQLEQGGADPLVPQEWSDDLARTLRGLGKKVTYYTYPRNDHNLSKDWNTVVQRDLEFFKKN